MNTENGYTPRAADLAGLPNQPQTQPSPDGPSVNGADALENSVEAFCQAMVRIAKYQGQVLENWNAWCPQWFLAPAQLDQEIFSRWVVGGQVNIYGSSDPPLEENIIRNVAGYGSQLGTIEDCLAVVLKQIQLDPEKLTDEKAKDAVTKFQALLRRIGDAKTVTKGKSRVAVAPIRQMPT